MNETSAICRQVTSGVGGEVVALVVVEVVLRVNSAGGFLRKPLDLLHPHQSVMLVSVSQFHHFYSIP